MNKPLVSVVLPAFNVEDFIEQSIDSILNQSYENIELLIINDGSTDETKNIVLSRKDKRIIYYENKKNLGLVKSLNKGFYFSQGEFIARMDADDVALPHRLQTQLDFLLSNDNISILGSNVIYKSTGTPAKVITRYNQHSVYLLKGNTIYHPTVLIRKKNIQEMKLFYDKTCAFAEDYKLWIDSCICNLKIENLDTPLLIYNDVNSNKISEKHKFVQREISEKIKISYAAYYFGSLITENISLYRILINDLIPATHQQKLDCIYLALELMKKNRESSFFDTILFDKILNDTISSY